MRKIMSYEYGGGACGTCYDFFINHLTYTTLATALLTAV
jgi:hypothetical protein